MNIEEIQNVFISEALSAPALFADLAKVELYIAESYRSRAFIELLQNADDAGAQRFLICQVGKQLLVANDGRSFTQDDLIAVCRSGASNKRRGSGTIGYRGIGFKSVAGIAHEIDIVSGDCMFRFSKAITRQRLGSDADVPLIRIPHTISADEPDAASLAAPLLAGGMNTVFILSGLDERMVAEEAQTFDESAMLFLNNVSRVEIALPDVRRDLGRSATRRKDGLSIEQIGSGDELRSWLVSGSEGGCEKIAFALEADTIVAAPPSQSVIHAFMPTAEFTGALLKMNGDFSTDPSRKSVDLDDTSVAAFERCAKLLANVLHDAVADNSLPGIFSPFLLTAPVEGRFRKTLRETLLQELNAEGLDIAGMRAEPLEIRLRPEWLPYPDYESLCRNLPHLPQATLSQHPQLPDFLKWLGARALSLEEALPLMHQILPSPLGCAQIFSRVARQYRYDLTAERIEMLATAPLLPVARGSCSPRDYRDEPLLPEFREFLMQQQEADDIRYLSKRLGLPEWLLVAPIPHAQAARSTPESIRNPSPNSGTEPSMPHHSLFRTPPAIKAWRSAEQNALVWLSALSDVLTVKDVSQANVGYDLEVFKCSGDSMYVEVKSVVRFGDPIRLTNNEHATAYQLGESYFLALVVSNSDCFEIRLIKDPIRAVPLEKRCEQWSWYCENYIDELIEYREIYNDCDSGCH